MATSPEPAPGWCEDILYSPSNTLVCAHVLEEAERAVRLEDALDFPQCAGRFINRAEHQRADNGIKRGISEGQVLRWASEEFHSEPQFSGAPLRTLKHVGVWLRGYYMLYRFIVGPVRSGSCPNLKYSTRRLPGHARPQLTEELALTLPHYGVIHGRKPPVPMLSMGRAAGLHRFPPGGRAHFLPIMFIIPSMPFIMPFMSRDLPGSRDLTVRRRCKQRACGRGGSQRQQGCARHHHSVCQQVPRRKQLDGWASPGIQKPFDPLFRWANMTGRRCDCRRRGVLQQLDQRRCHRLNAQALDRLIVCPHFKPRQIPLAE